MREISFVKKLKFKFTGCVVKRALVIGDADNDQHNELLCASLKGDLSIFKERNPEKYAFADNLGMVTACAIGDVMNSGRNYVMAIDMEGWLFILSVPIDVSSPTFTMSPIPPSSENNYLEESRSSQGLDKPIELDRLYCQRMPANCKELLLVDLDGDGQNELIIGLTDRVLRTYKWIKIGHEQGKFVGLYKWEFADQIGSVSLTPSGDTNRQDIIVAQPGGTYAKLECYDKKLMSSSHNHPDSGEDKDIHSAISASSPRGDDNVKTEYISKLTPEYHQLALSRMRNPHVSTEALGGIRNNRDSNRGTLIALATLDGTLMLVDKDEIRWNIQVDHQLFALAVLETEITHKQTLPQSESSCTIIANTEYSQSTDNSSPKPKKDEQYIVACAWNGKTYIIDEERNYLRFKFEEAISAFMAGNYYFDGQDHACLVYTTFNNEIVVYYDVVSESISPSYLLDEIVENPENIDLLSNLETLMDGLKMSDYGNRYLKPYAKYRGFYNIIHDILYGISDQDLNS